MYTEMTELFCPATMTWYCIWWLVKWSNFADWTFASPFIQWDPLPPGWWDHLRGETRSYYVDSGYRIQGWTSWSRNRKRWPSAIHWPCWWCGKHSPEKMKIQNFIFPNPTARTHDSPQSVGSGLGDWLHSPARLVSSASYLFLRAYASWL